MHRHSSFNRVMAVAAMTMGLFASAAHTAAEGIRAVGGALRPLRVDSRNNIAPADGWGQHGKRRVSAAAAKRAARKRRNCRKHARGAR